MRRICVANFLLFEGCIVIIVSMDTEMQIILAEGESYQIEFKEKLAQLDRTIVAFANATGGTIYLGIRDDGSIIGIDTSNEMRSKVQEIARNCDPSISIHIKPHPKDQILEVQVEEGTDKPYRCKDGFFLRNGPSSQKLRRNEIVELINQSGKIYFDEAINKHFQYPQDFSKTELSEYLHLCDLHINAPDQDILCSINAAEKDKKLLNFRNVGVLFFGKNPQQFFPEAYITCVAYKSFDRYSIIDRKDIKGQLIKQVEEALQFIIKHMSVESIMVGVGSRLGQRQEIYDYPIVALKEAVINAVTHRDYQYGSSHIYIHMYPDRIEIVNPGGLHHGLKLDSLGKLSVRRNRHIADLMQRAKYIENIGSGFNRMETSLKANGNPPLDVSATDFFNIRFYKRMGQEQLELTKRQQHLYRILEQRQEISKKEAALALDVSEDTALRELKVLIEKGFAIIVGEGRATKYRKTS